MLIFNPIIALILNTATGRYHPVVFEEKPLPGESLNKPVRHKSKLHHTAGFDTREAAIEHAEKQFQPKLEGSTLRLDNDFEWDGEGVPLIVHFFH